MKKYNEIKITGIVILCIFILVVVVTWIRSTLVDEKLKCTEILRKETEIAKMQSEIATEKNIQENIDIIKMYIDTKHKGDK